MTFYWLIIALLVLFFQMINKTIPDPASWQGSDDNLIHFAIASLVVVYPTYVWVASFLRKHQLRPSTFRIYLTLFVTSMTALVDVVVLLLRYLDGELSLRTILKIVSVLLVMVVVFEYEKWNLAREPHRLQKKEAFLIGIVHGIVLVLVASGVYLSGSPMQARAAKFDEQRVQHLYQVQDAIRYHWQSNSELPETLDDLSFGTNLPVDPRTGASYEYRPLESNTFEVCAAFETVSESVKHGYITDPYVANDIWGHGIGRQCFKTSVLF